MGARMTIFIVAMAMSTVLSVSPIAASAQCETLGDSDTTAQGNNANPFQGADELLDDDDEATDGTNSQSTNTGNDFNTIVALNTGVANCNAQTGSAPPQSNSLTGLAVNDFDAINEALGG
jgi:hypothetical protein